MKRKPTHATTKAAQKCGADDWGVLCEDWPEPAAICLDWPEPGEPGGIEAPGPIEAPGWIEPPAFE